MRLNASMYCDILSFVLFMLKDKNIIIECLKRDKVLEGT